MRFPSREKLEAYQLERLNQLLAGVRHQNPFYRSRLAMVPDPLRSLAEWSSVPMTDKKELSAQADEHGFGPHHTFDRSEYVRLHRTSGTSGRPLIIMDRAIDWEWWIEVWKYTLDAAQIEPTDVVFMAFSFGPFVGFWSATDACLRRGCLLIPGGGLSTVARLDLIQATRSTALFCTPSYALHLADEATRRGMNAAELGIRKLVVAGEPGGSIPAVRKRLESHYQAQVIDHVGATEVGPWGYGTADGTAIEIIESEFLAEFLPISSTGVSNSEGELYELVLTSLGRIGAPAIRYRTGDIVRPNFSGNKDSVFARLEGGVLGRVDQMVTIRGINVFPSSIDAILTEAKQTGEYRMIASRLGNMDHLTIEMEGDEQGREIVRDLLDRRLGLKVDVKIVDVGVLQRSIEKAKRFVDLR
jgi:phenylacetate-CoA ligase